MRTSIVIPVLLGAGAIAHPHFKLNNPLAHVHHKRQQPAEVLTKVVGGEVEIEDVYVSTVYGNNPPTAPTVTPSVTPAVAPERLVAPVQPQKEEDHAPAPAPVSVTPTSTPPAPASTTPPPAASSTPASTGGNDGAPTSGGKSILESANKFRSLMGFPTFTYSSTLGANAAKTNNDDGANTMTHELNPGSMAQCIAEVDNTSGTAQWSSFELTYLAWLCEIPDSRLGDDCNQMLQATNMQMNYADPGHAQILRNPQYTKMGCNYMDSTQHQANFAGMYTCDFA